MFTGQFERAGPEVNGLNRLKKRVKVSQQILKR